MTASFFRSLSVLRPDDPDLSEKLQWRIQAYRLLSLLGAGLVPLFGGLYWMGSTAVVDPIWGRAVFSLGFLGIVVGSYVSDWARRHYVSVVQTYLYGVMAWFAVLAVLNQMSGDYAVGLLFVYGVLGICVSIGVDTTRPLIWFLGYGVLLAGAGCVILPSPKTNPLILMSCIVSMALVLHVVVQAQLSMRRTLRRMTEEAQAANQLKSALLSNMSHEVRTPLTSILGFAELIAEDDADDPQALAGRIHESGNRLLDTLNAVLQVSRLESGAVDLEPERLDATAVVADCAEAAEPLAREQDVALTIDTPNAPVSVHLDRVALRRIADVLVRNAVEFSEAGDRVRIAVRAEGGHLMLVIEDTGVGIQEDALDEVFKAFEQGSVGQARTHEGTGLGLTIAHRLVDLMDGTIEVESEKGEGTCVVVRLPYREPAPAP